MIFKFLIFFELFEEPCTTFFYFFYIYLNNKNIMKNAARSDVYINEIRVIDFGTSDYSVIWVFDGILKC